MALTEADLKNLPKDGIDAEDPGKYETLLKDLQGNILKSHGREHSVHLFLKWKSDRVYHAKKWIKDFATDPDPEDKQADDDLNILLQAVNRITPGLREVAEIVHREDGFVLRNENNQVIEHFGFADGVSQPLFLKRDIVKARTNDCNFSQWDPRAS